MNTITRFTARNFQSHENSTIVPGPAGTLTVLTGGSDEGKSALLRALKWSYYNQPQGDSFRRVGCDFVEVEVETDAGTVVRRRTSTTNRYIVNGETLEGFGNTVPLEVQQVAGVRTVRLGDQEIMANLAGQLDAPFLGSSISGPARAKVLGKLAGIEVMDKALRDLNGDVHRIRTQARHLEDEAERLGNEIAQYDHLPNLAESIEYLRGIAKRIRTAEERRKMLSNHFDTLSANQMIRHAETAKLEQWNRLSEAEAAIDQYEDLSTRRKRVKRCFSQVTHIRKWESESRQTVESLSHINKAASATERVGRAIERKCRLESLQSRVTYTRFLLIESESSLRVANQALQTEPTYKKAVEAITKVDRLHWLRSKLDDIRQQQQQTTGQIELATQMMARATQVYERTLFEVGTCPTCGAPANHDHIKEVVNQ